MYTPYWLRHAGCTTVLNSPICSYQNYLPLHGHHWFKMNFSENTLSQFVVLVLLYILVQKIHTHPASILSPEVVLPRLRLQLCQRQKNSLSHDQKKHGEHMALLIRFFCTISLKGSHRRAMTLRTRLKTSHEMTLLLICWIVSVQKLIFQTSVKLDNVIIF